MRTRVTLRGAIFAAALTLIPMPLVAQEQQEAATRPGVVIADLLVIPATVENVDKANRVVTLRGPEGRTVDVKVDPRVQNFDQIAKGDKLQAEFYEETAIFVRTATEQPKAGESGTLALAPKGEKPGVVGVNTKEITARVEDIDYQARTVTLRGPQGNTRTIKVSDKVERFNEVKAGDELVIRVTEAVAIGMTKQ